VTRFCVEAFFRRSLDAYVLVRQIDPGDFALADSPVPGDAPIRRWLAQPRKLKPDGSPDFSVFAFVLASDSDIDRLRVGDVVELSGESASGNEVMKG
jgi:hypothetical protein